jgi:thiol-disulfide isomerase/thioredoxin
MAQWDKRFGWVWARAVAVIAVAATCSVAQADTKKPAANDGKTVIETEGDTDKTSEADPAASPIPIIEVDEPRFDFGDVWISDTLEHAFTIRNTGTAPLRIIRVKPSCGCTVAGKHPQEIQPGSSGEFPFKLNSKRLHGKFAKSITVTTNDPKSGQLHFTLSGNVRHFVEMSPKLVQFGRVKADSTSTHKVTLTNNTNNPIKLSVKPGIDLQCFDARIEETMPGKQFDLIVTAKPPYRTGINRVVVPVETSLPEQSELQVTVMATLPERIELRPPRIQLSGRLRNESVRKIWFTNNDEAPINVVSADATDERVKVEMVPVEPGRKYRFDVTLPEGYNNPETNAAVVVKTDDAKNSEVRIPIIDRRAKRKRPEPRRPAMTMLGKPAPESKTVTFKGDSVEVGGEHDKVQMLTFYASWCGFCKRALPKIEELQKQYADNKEVEIIAINQDDRSGRRARSAAESIKHYETMGLSMPMVLDSDKEIAKPYKVTSFPTMVLIGKNGKVEAVHVGARAGFKDAISKQINMLLAGKTHEEFDRAVSSLPITKPKE